MRLSMAKTKLRSSESANISAFERNENKKQIFAMRNYVPYGTQLSACAHNYELQAVRNYVPDGYAIMLLKERSLSEERKDK